MKMIVIKKKRQEIQKSKRNKLVIMVLTTIFFSSLFILQYLSSEACVQFAHTFSRCTADDLLIVVRVGMCDESDVSEPIQKN
jgi:hypothetical protein